MRKLWVLLALIIIVSSQVAVLSSFHSIGTNTWATGSTLVVISKAAYAHLRVEIDINPQVSNGQSNTTLIFSNGTSTKIPVAMHYKFSVILSSTGPYTGSFALQTEGINVSTNRPIDVEFVANSNSTLQQTLSQYQTYPGLSSGISVYWFLIQGNAQVSIQGYGVAL
jgi:hypothetical protein